MDPDDFNPSLISGGDHTAIDQPAEDDLVQSPLVFLDTDEEVTE